MSADVQLSAAQVLDRLGHLELRYKQAGAVNEAGGIRLAIVEVMRLAEEARKAGRPPSTDVSALSAHLL
jgi:hypothetical protein